MSMQFLLHIWKACLSANEGFAHSSSYFLSHSVFNGTTGAGEGNNMQGGTSGSSSSHKQHLLLQGA